MLLLASMGYHAQGASYRQLWTLVVHRVQCGEIRCELRCIREYLMIGMEGRRATHCCLLVTSGLLHLIGAPAWRSGKTCQDFPNYTNCILYDGDAWQFPRHHVWRCCMTIASSSKKGISMQYSRAATAHLFCGSVATRSAPRPATAAPPVTASVTEPSSSASWASDVAAWAAGA